MNKLPGKIFVTFEEVELGGGSLHAAVEKGDLVGMHETKEIGEYVLKRRVEIKGVAEELREIG